MSQRPSLSPHVLVVEDEPAQREILAYNLEPRASA
jgi:CheY-like chemotaxis protein